MPEAHTQTGKPLRCIFKKKKKNHGYIINCLQYMKCGLGDLDNEALPSVTFPMGVIPTYQSRPWLCQSPEMLIKNTDS